jgi:hypothetical protein
MRVLAVVTDPPEVRRIILHLIKTGVVAEQNLGRPRPIFPPAAIHMAPPTVLHLSPSPYPLRRAPEGFPARQAQRIGFPTSRCPSTSHRSALPMSWWLPPTARASPSTSL